MISDTRHQLARLVQRLRRQVRGEVQLGGDQARLLPASDSDVVAALALAHELQVPVVMGGGTLLAGIDMAESHAALHIDALAHLTRAAHFDERRGMIELQAGVRLADINRLLAPRGWWLPVETSPDCGATVAGLVARDAVAAAPAWGTMADRLVGIDAVLADGTQQLFGPFGERSSVALTSGRAGQLVSSLFGMAAGVQGEIRQRWPAGMRVPDGYLLDAFHPRPGRPYTPDGAVNLAHLLAGSAGTLAWSARLHLQLLRRPAISRWALFVFASAQQALVRAAQAGLLEGGGGAGGGGPSAVLLLDGEDLAQLRASRHPADRALADMTGAGTDSGVGGAGFGSGFGFGAGAGAGAGPGLGAGSAPGMADVTKGVSGRAAPGCVPAGLLVRFSGDHDAAVQAAHRRLAAALDPSRRTGSGGLVLAEDGTSAREGVASGRAEGAPGSAPHAQAGERTGAAAGAMYGRHAFTAVWRRLLGELVMPAGAASYVHPAIEPALSGMPGAAGASGAPGVSGAPGIQGASGAPGIPEAPGMPAAAAPAGMWMTTWRLWPQVPQTCPALIPALEDRLASVGVQSCWRGQLLAGDLQMRAHLSAQQMARVSAALAAAQPARWTPALQAAFGQVKAAFDPRGILPALLRSHA